MDFSRFENKDTFKMFREHVAPLLLRDIKVPLFSLEIGPSLLLKQLKVAFIEIFLWHAFKQLYVTLLHNGENCDRYTI